jgi:outer membrane protein OmpA-like peptidoglycan-associated protein
MKKIKYLTLGMCVAVVCSCSTKAGTGSIIGAGGGAVIGGILGNIIGKDSKATAIGAAIGSAVGAGSGALIGKHMDKVAAETAAQVENAKVETVTDANGLSCVKVTFDSGILFKTGKYDLNDASKNELANFAEVLKKNTDCSVDIQGYTDNVGSDAVNNPLSQNRAESVASYLKQKGVSNNQLKNVTGFGASNFVADNSTEAGRQQNRRVEVYMYASEAMINAANSGTLR